MRRQAVFVENSGDLKLGGHVIGVLPVCGMCIFEFLSIKKSVHSRVHLRQCKWEENSSRDDHSKNYTGDYGIGRPDSERNHCDCNADADEARYYAEVALDHPM